MRVLTNETVGVSVRTWVLETDIHWATFRNGGHMGEATLDLRIKIGS